MTLNGVIALFSFIPSNSIALQANYGTAVEDRPIEIVSRISSSTFGHN